jgi:hypothetical protein
LAVEVAEEDIILQLLGEGEVEELADTVSYSLHPQRHLIHIPSEQEAVEVPQILTVVTGARLRLLECLLVAEVAVALGEGIQQQVAPVEQRAEGQSM